MDKVILSPEAFRQILSSALEAYAVPQGRSQNEKSHNPLETYGSLWGFSKEEDGNCHFLITAADTETSAHRRPDSVLRKIGAQHIKAGLNEQFNPELSYLGDFHSHPYSQGEKVPTIHGGETTLNTAQDVEVSRVFRFSGKPGNKDGDFASVRCLKASNAPYRVGIVATIYRMSVCVENDRTSYLTEYSDQKSAIRFTYTGPDASGQRISFRCWLKAYTFNGNDDIHTPFSEISLQCGTLGLKP